MKRCARVLARLYALLLHLYPRAYRAEYGEELQTVYTLAVNEAAQQGGLAPVWLGLRELRDLPRAITLEHRRERRKRRMATKGRSHFVFEPGSWRETLAALAPFLLLGVLPSFFGLGRVRQIISPWLGSTLTLGLGGLLAGLFVAGLLKGMPRWVLPYVGFVIAGLSVFVFFELISGLHAVLVDRRDPWFLRQVVYQGLLWIGLFVITLVIVLMARISPRSRPFYWRVRRDWTLLSFTLYGASLLALVLTFDDYPYDEPYVIIGMLILAVGGWFYLHSSHPWQRVLALFAGMTLAMAVAAMGKAMIYSRLGWPHYLHFTWQIGAMSTAIMWGWLVLMTFAPVLLNLLPRHNKVLFAE